MHQMSSEKPMPSNDTHTLSESASQLEIESFAPTASSDPTPNVIDGVAYAKLYGEPLFQLPTDLYIPPEALEVFLEAFEGPLDLLLYLIRRQHFNILDIPMAEVTKQYLIYIEQIRERNLELAAEYLLMAAMLIEIKSRMLLPQRKSNPDEEPEDPRAELVRRLLEYEQIKLAAQSIDAIPQLGRDFVRAQITTTQNDSPNWPEIDLSDLSLALEGLLRRAQLNARHTITREALSVREHMSSILRQLQNAQFIEFSELFDPHAPASVLIVNFIALLELAKDSQIELTQIESLAPIYVRLASEPA